MSFLVQLCITDRCNLGCPYCYVANKKKSLTKEIILSAMTKVKEHMKHIGEKSYNINYFGGEPLLEYDLIKELVPIFNADPMCDFQFIVTNGTLLTEEKYEFLKDNMGISWSFDGIGSEKSRPLLKVPENDGFTDILEVYNAKRDLILEASGRGCKCMIYPGNAGNMLENLKFMIDFGVQYIDFAIVRDDIWEPKDIEVFRKEIVRVREFLEEEFQQGHEIGCGFLDLMIDQALQALLFGKHKQSCFAGTTGCAIGVDGKIYGCQRFAQDHVLEYEDDYPFLGMQSVLEPNFHEECRGCDIDLICKTGCQYSQIKNGNRVLPSVCELYHILYSEAFKMCHNLKDCKTWQLWRYKRSKDLLAHNQNTHRESPKTMEKISKDYNRAR